MYKSSVTPDPRKVLTDTILAGISTETTRPNVIAEDISILFLWFFSYIEKSMKPPLCEKIAYYMV
jgi:hypothetical protein